MVEGDTNSKYFHASATTRKKRSAIHCLRNENGEIVSDHDGMCNIVKEYFQKLFEPSAVLKGDDTELYDNMVSTEQNMQLITDFTFDEFSLAVRHIHPDMIRVQVLMISIMSSIRIFGTYLVVRCLSVVGGGCRWGLFQQT